MNEYVTVTRFFFACCAFRRRVTINTVNVNCNKRGFIRSIHTYTIYVRQWCCPVQGRMKREKNTDCTKELHRKRWKRQTNAKLIGATSFIILYIERYSRLHISPYRYLVNQHDKPTRKVDLKDSLSRRRRADDNSRYSWNRIYIRCSIKLTPNLRWVKYNIREATVVCVLKGKRGESNQVLARKRNFAAKFAT